MNAWKDIPGYEGLYQVNLLGQVKRLGGSVGCKNDRLLKIRLSAGGYKSVALSKNSKPKETAIHRCLMLAFVGFPPTPLHEVNHKDGNKLNNDLSNLEWVTASENMKHAITTGLKKAKQGKNNYAAKLTDCKVMEIRRRFAAGERHGNLGKEFGISANHVRDIAAGNKWKHLPVIDNKKERGNHFMKLTCSNVREIRNLRSQGWLIREIAEKFKVSMPTIVNTVNGKYHADVQ